MEGYFDVIRAGTVGVYNCVAPMGTSLTKKHIKILKKITNNIKDILGVGTVSSSSVSSSNVDITIIIGKDYK